MRSRPLIAFCWCASAYLLISFTGLAISGPGPNPGPIDYIGTAIFGLVLSLGFLRATRMRIELSDRGVTVFGFVRTTFMPWSELADVSADYGGLRLVRIDGVVVTAGSLGKPNWATWLRRRTAADRRVDVIRERMLTGRTNANP